MRQNVYFLSDFHLGASYISDPRGHERRIVNFLLSLKDKADAIYLLGDVLDFWFEYRTVVPRGYIRFFGALTSLADAGVKIYWFLGNHDIWLFDYLRDEIGLTVVDNSLEISLGDKRFFLAHGDGVGKLRPGFKFIRAIFHNRLCQKLLAAIHPRWTIPFAHRWSSSSRGKGSPARFRGEEEPQIVFARQHILRHPDIDYFIFGHRHILKQYPLNDKTQLIMLGDCFSQFTYAVFDGEKLSLEKF